MIIVNRSKRQDVLQTVRADVCETVELHRSSMDDEGVMRMAPVPDGRIVVPAGERVALAPGGLHVMCIGLVRPLRAGQTVSLTLDFEVAGSIDVVADIRREGP